MQRLSTQTIERETADTEPRDELESSVPMDVLGIKKLLIVSIEKSGSPNVLPQCPDDAAIQRKIAASVPRMVARGNACGVIDSGAPGGADHPWRTRRPCRVTGIDDPPRVPEPGCLPYPAGGEKRLEMA